MTKIVGKDAARSLATAWEGRGQGHVIGYFKNISGDITLFETYGHRLIFAERFDDEQDAERVIRMIKASDQQ